MRRLVPPAVAVLTAIAIAACGGQEEPIEQGEPAIEVIEVNPRNLTLPLDAYLQSDASSTVVGDARNILFQRCMRDFGFDLAMPSRQEGPPFARNQERYGLSDETRAARHGYHVPEITERTRAAESQLTSAGEAVASGTGPRTVNGKEVPEGGCAEESVRRLTQGAPAPENEALAKKLSLDSYRQSTTDSRTMAVFATWSACMKKLGFDYASPRDANNDPQFDTPGPTKHEIAVATADTRCKKETDVVNVWAAVEKGYQTRAVERNSEALHTIKKMLDAQVTNANAVLSGK